MPSAPKARLKRRNPLEIALGIVLLIAALYFGQDVLIPLALSVLLTFLLTPAVAGLQRLRLPRIPAVLTVAAVAFGLILAIGWVVGLQIKGLASDLPRYQGRVEDKVNRVKNYAASVAKSATGKATTGPASAADAAVPPADAGPAANAKRAVRQTVGRAATELSDAAEDGVAPKPEAPPTATSQPVPDGSEARPLYVYSASSESNLERLGTYVGTIVAPLGTAALVVVFVVFMLLDREDLRDRAIRLLSRGKYTVTTRALDDAGRRISRYVLAQSIINGSYGVIVGVGLFVIGASAGHGTAFPSWVLWGLLAALLRFIPYVGPVTAAVFPLALSLAAYDGFTVFALVAAMLILIELVSNNVMEPWLYGSSTGLSTMAILVAAVFWTWLWGPIGLFMSTPLTVCIVVLGKYVTQLKFLDVMLGDQPALPPGVRFYQRLLANDPHEAELVMAEVVKHDGGDLVADNVMLPALRLARRDHLDGDLSADEEAGVLDRAAGQLEKRLAATEANLKAAGRAVPGTADADAMPCGKQVVGCPAHHRAEELTLEALNQLGLPDTYCIDILSSRLMHAQVEKHVAEKRPQIVFIAVLPPGGTPQARYLCRRLRRAFPDLHIVVGYWGRVRDFDRLLVRFRKAGASYVTTSMRQSRNQIVALLKPPA